MTTFDFALFPVSRKAARKAGWLFYFNGKFCVNGHLSLRYSSCNRCVGCIHDVCHKLKLKTAERKAARPLSIRQQAQADGQHRYMSGRPCIYPMA
jgi:hypothetical protein